MYLDIGGLKKKTIQSWPKRSLTQKRTLKLKSTDGITRWTEEIAMNNGLMFDDFLQAVEWAEENIREDFEVIRQPDGRYLVRECE